MTFFCFFSLVKQRKEGHLLFNPSTSSGLFVSEASIPRVPPGVIIIQPLQPSLKLWLAGDKLGVVCFGDLCPRISSGVIVVRPRWGLLE